MLGLAEMITAVDENAPLVYVLMNDQAYGVEVDMVAIGPFAESFSGPPTGAAGNKV